MPGRVDIRYMAKNSDFYILLRNIELRKFRHLLSNGVLGRQKNDLGLIRTLPFRLFRGSNWTPVLILSKNRYTILFYDRLVFLSIILISAVASCLRSTAGAVSLCASLGRSALVRRRVGAEEKIRQPQKYSFGFV